jgi:hypothetical protein
MGFESKPLIMKLQMVRGHRNETWPSAENVIHKLSLKGATHQSARLAALRGLRDPESPPLRTSAGGIIITSFHVRRRGACVFFHALDHSFSDTGAISQVPEGKTEAMLYLMPNDPPQSDQSPMGLSGKPHPGLDRVFQKQPGRNLTFQQDVSR